MQAEGEGSALGEGGLPFWGAQEISQWLALLPWKPYS